jgi:plastocyanin
MGRLPFLPAAVVAAASAFGAVPSIALSAIGAPVDTARRAAVSGTPVAQTAEPVAVSIVEPPLKPPPTWTYEPKVVTVEVGTKVTWTNNGAVVHTATADDGKTFDSGNMQAKATFSFTPAAPGTFAYHCRQHPWMKGTIIVQP